MVRAQCPLQAAPGPPVVPGAGRRAAGGDVCRGMQSGIGYGSAPDPASAGRPDIQRVLRRAVCAARAAQLECGQSEAGSCRSLRRTADTVRRRPPIPRSCYTCCACNLNPGESGQGVWRELLFLNFVVESQDMTLYPPPPPPHAGVCARKRYAPASLIP